MSKQILGVLPTRHAFVVASEARKHRPVQHGKHLTPHNSASAEPETLSTWEVLSFIAQDHLLFNMNTSVLSWASYHGKHNFPSDHNQLRLLHMNWNGASKKSFEKSQDASRINMLLNVFFQNLQRSQLRKLRLRVIDTWRVWALYSRDVVDLTYD